MAERRLVFLVEEPSMEAFLRALLPRVLPAVCDFDIHSFQGKPDLLGKLDARLRGYASWLPADWQLFVLVDRDDDDCHALKARLEQSAAGAGLMTRSSAAAGKPWQLVNRIVIEELEAWYFGDWQGVRSAYPRVSPNVVNRRGLRKPDAIAGGTWETFERVMQRAGYFKTGLRKTEAARDIGSQLHPGRNRSGSFQMFHAALLEAVS